jgi:hypothetical protein
VLGLGSLWLPMLKMPLLGVLIGRLDVTLFGCEDDF